MTEAVHGQSDLIDLVHHEHDHMGKLFADLRETFQSLAGDQVADDVKLELVETASEDLRVAFDDLLHHFSQEEEVFFVHMEKRFPDLSEEIADLVKTHEFVCERTRWLQRVLTQDVAAVTSNLARIGETLTTLQQTLLDHTNTENEIFGAALRKMSAREREELLREMREIG